MTGTTPEFAQCFIIEESWANAICSHKWLGTHLNGSGDEGPENWTRPRLETGYIYIMCHKCSLVEYDATESWYRWCLCGLVFTPGLMLFAMVYIRLGITDSDGLCCDASLCQVLLNVLSYYIARISVWKLMPRRTCVIPRYSCLPLTSVCLVVGLLVLSISLDSFMRF